MNLPIRWRLALSFAAFSGGVFALWGSVLFVLTDARLRWESKNETQRIAAEVELNFQRMPWAQALQEMEEESKEFDVVIQVLDSLGRPVFLSAGWSPWEWPKTLEGPRKGGSTLRLRGLPHMVFSQEIGGGPGPRSILQVARPMAERVRVRQILGVAINLGTLLALMFSVGAGLFFAARALAPLESIRRAADALNASNLGSALPAPPRRDELFALTETLNRLLARVHESYLRVARFTADVSHELRAPLTALKGAIEVVLLRDRTPEDYRVALRSAGESTDQLVRLVEDLLLLAKSDAGQIGATTTAVFLPDYMETVWRQAVTWAEGKKAAVRLDPLPKKTIFLDPSQTRRLLWNLIDNALQHSPVGTTVHLGAREENGGVSLYVRDQGPGVLPEDRERIFDRFFRSDSSRSRETGGAGLGLAIARSIAEGQGGTLTHRAPSEGGSEFLFHMRTF